MMPKALLIDSAARTVSEVQMPAENQANYRKIRELINGPLEACWQSRDGDVLYVDEEFMLHEPLGQHWFMFKHRPDQPLGGNGVINGREIIDQENGDWIGTADVTMTVEHARSLVRWMTLREAQAWARANSSEPASTITTDEEHIVIGRMGELFRVSPADDRAAHIKWAQERALEYLDRGEPQQATASIVSDMTKHPGCELTPPQLYELTMLTLRAVQGHSARPMRDFIKGLK